MRHSMAAKERTMLTLVLGYTAMWLLGYWAAHIRLAGQRIQVLRLMRKADEILGIAKALDQLEKLTPDRSKVSDEDTTVQRDT